MKKIKHKIALELMRYITKSNPELCPRFEEIIITYQNKSFFDINFILLINESLLKKSKSQIRQDLFVLSELNYKRNGFFVEFGATNGIDLSNTYLLETDYEWNGILAEPARLWHNDLDRNRKAIIDKRCVWKRSGETLIFNETSYAELSTIDSLSASDCHAKSRESGKKYPVQTISLSDLLTEHKAPKEIDYLSIDTEGSEFDILENFDFQEYKFKVITCEHNFSPMREKLDALFQKNGYHKKYGHLSLGEDWWVLN
jgi:FkbM family methyltransferase